MNFVGAVGEPNEVWWNPVKELKVFTPRLSSPRKMMWNPVKELKVTTCRLSKNMNNATWNPVKELKDISTPRGDLSRW